MNLKKHIIEQPFIFATGLAALIHSTWSLGTIFAGKQPDTSNPLELIGWLLPALLIAFALDIGQIVTSAEIRAGQRTRAKYATFIIFAIATYYLQWLYIAHHMPQLELSGGVRAEWSYNITILRDLAVWIVPALLPLSTALYTLSQGDSLYIEVKADDSGMYPGQRPSNLPAIEQPDVELLPDTIEEDETETLPQYDEEETEPYEPIEADNADDHYHNLTCPDCGWETGPRLRLESAERALRTHQARYCNLLLEVE